MSVPTGTISSNSILQQLNYNTADGESIAALPAYANNAAAVVGGLVVGQLYRTNGDPDLVAVVHA